MDNSKPKFKYEVNTSLFNMNYMKVYVQLHLSKEVDDNGKTEKQVTKYVTDVKHHPEKLFKYEDGKHAYAFDSISTALDFCVAVAVNGYCASVVLAPTWNSVDIYTNPKKEDGNDELGNE